MVLLTLQDVSKSFGLNRILSGVNLTLKEGARMGLVGVNGSGKSTLMKLISGGMQPDTGTVSLMKGAQVGLLTQQADIDSRCSAWRSACARWSATWLRSTPIPRPWRACPRTTPA